MSDQAAHVLSYESRADAARPWGPWLWRPSVMAMVLLILVAGMGAWVKWRHEAWRVLWRGGMPGIEAMVLGRDDRLLLVAGDSIELWDVDQNKLVASHDAVRDLQPPTDRVQFEAWVRRLPKDGGNVAIWRFGGKGFLLVKMDDGSLVQKADGIAVSDVSPDGHRVVGPVEGFGVNTPHCVWNDTGERASSGKVFGNRVSFSGDGRFIVVQRILLNPTSGPADLGSSPAVAPRWELTLLDAVSLAPVASFPDQSPARDDDFIAGDHVLCEAARGVASGEGVWSITSGSRVATVPPGILGSWANMAPSGQRLATYYAASNPTGWYQERLEVMAVPAGRTIYDIPVGEAFRPRFVCGNRIRYVHAQRLVFLDERRFVSMGAQAEVWLMSTETRYPLAVLGCKEPGDMYAVPGGNTIAVLGKSDQLTVWRKVGYECRESILGILGMPHVWGLIAAGLLLALVAWRDARRGRGRAGAMMSAASLAMVLVGAGMSLVLFLEWCIGRREPNVGPALLLCGLGLATAGRGWRWIALVALAGCLALGAWGLQAMFSAGLQHDVWLRILDRVWEVPSLWPFAALSVGLAAAAGAIVVVARRAS